MANRRLLVAVPTRRALRAAAWIAVAVLAAGCASTASRKAAPYAIELKADPRVNPDASGRPSPIQVTLYELRSSAEFEARDFFTLEGDAQAALGKSLIETDQVILQPGETRKLSYPGNTEARVVGIVAAYRDLERSPWRIVVPLPQAQNTNIYKFWQFSPNEETVRVAVGGQGVQIVDRERSWWPF